MIPQIEPQAPISSHLLGRLEGRMDAFEVRVTRNEDAANARLSGIEQKLDQLSTTLAQGLGGMRVAHWIGGSLLAIGGFFVSHFLVHPP